MDTEPPLFEDLTDQLLVNPLFTRLVRDFDSFKSTIQNEVSKLAQDLNYSWESRKDMESTISQLELNVKDSRRDLDRGLRLMDDDSQRFNSFATEMTRISNMFDEIYTDLRLKATLKELSAMENRFSFMCPMTTAQKLQYDLEEKANSADVVKLREDFERFRVEANHDFNRKKELQDAVSRVTSQYTEALKPYSKDSDCLNRHKEANAALKSQGNALARDISVLTQTLAVTNATLQQTREILETKSSLEELKEVELTFAHYSTVHDFSKFRKDMSTLMRKCENRIEEFSAAISGQDQVLARYDELLLDKASKLDLKDVNNKIRSISKHIDFETKVEEMDRVITDTAAMVSALGQQLASMDKGIAEALNVTRSVKSEKKDIMFLKEKVALFQELFELKADKVDLMKLGERKANADDLHQTLQSIDILHRLMKMSAVLLNHTLKGMFAKPQDSKNAEVARKDWLLKHAEIVVNWANDFSPLQPDNKIPEESLAFTPPSPLGGVPPPQIVESPKFGSSSGTHRRFKTRAIKLPSIDTSF